MKSGAAPARDTSRQSLERLFRSNVDQLYGFLISRCGSEHLAEELTARTFEEAARVFARGDGQAVDRSWLFTVGRRRLIDHWRSESRREAGVDRITNQVWVDAQSGETGDQSPLADALESLPTRQRAALMLRYMDGFSVAEVAECLGCSYESAESLLARGRRSLRTSMGAHTDG